MRTPSERNSSACANPCNLPRGWIHEAVSLEMFSLHLTIGAHPIQWGDIIQATIGSIVSNDRRFRAAMPPGFTSCPEQETRAREGLAALWAAATEAVELDDLFERAAIEARRKTSPSVERRLLDLHRTSEVCLHSEVSLRPISVKLWANEDECRLEYDKNVLQCPLALRECLEFIDRRVSFVVRELPDLLTPDDKVVLVRRLVEEGLLTIADGPPC